MSLPSNPRRPYSGIDSLEDREAFSSGLLRLYLFYRFFLGLLLLGVFSSRLAPQTFGHQTPDLYFSTAVIYVVIAVITLGFYQLQKHRLRPTQVFLTLVADIIILIILMFTSGGLGSGIAYLLLITVAVGAIFFTGQLAVLIPAVASILLILETIIAYQYFGESSDNILPAGVLGLLLFLTSILFSRLSKALLEAREMALSESELSAELQELNQLVLNRIRTGIVVVDSAGFIQQINTAARELLGQKPNNRVYAIGDSIRGEPRLLKRLLHWRKAPSSPPKPFIPKRGNTELQASFANLEQRDSDHTIIFLEDFRAAAQQAQQLKLASIGRLAGNIAHEIRNPLGAISHASELLAERQQEDKTTHRLTEIISAQVKRVNHIVESVLELSRKKRHNIEQLQLDAWLASFLKLYRQGKPDQIQIELLLPSEPMDTISFDQVHLQQVLTNLLDNALRFSQSLSGKPWAAIRVSCDSAESITTLDVIDAGPGVPKEYRKQLFEPFFTTSSRGTGLGLYIARELCAANYATIKYQAPEDDTQGYFRITFVHPKKILNATEEGND